MPTISVEVSHKSETGVLSRESAEDKKDLPCSLCDQLVLHLKDILVANTTEAEFKQVLKGKCNEQFVNCLLNDILCLVEEVVCKKETPI